MKSIISKLNGHVHLVFFPFLLFRKMNIPLAVIIVLVITGCFQKFYQSGTTNQIDQAKIESLKAQNKFFIIHFKDGNSFHLNNINISGDSLTAQSSYVGKTHATEYNADSAKPNQVPKSMLNEVLTEVHLYSNVKTGTGTGNISVAIKDIYRMDVYEFDQKATNRSKTWSYIGIGVTVLLLTALAVSVASISVGVAAPASGCGCPEIFLEKQGQYEYVNGVYSGAMYSNLERTDYLPLGEIKDAGNIRIRIDNTPGEIQYLNMVKLTAITHQPGTEVLADRTGKYHTIKDPAPPAMAIDEHNQDITQLVISNDARPYRFNNYVDDQGLAFTILEFNKVNGASHARLRIKAKNTNWAAAMNQDFIMLFGSEYPAWRTKKEKDDPGDMEKWHLKQGLPISVFVENGNDWSFVDYFPLSGTMGYRDLVMDIKLPASENNKIRIKLATVFNFWEIDQAALDISDEEELHPRFIEPTSVEDIEKLGSSDKKYLTLKENETKALVFQDAEKMGNTSYFLNAGGYYHNENYYPGDANKKALKEFREQEAFSNFSRSHYKAYQQIIALSKK